MMYMYKSNYIHYSFDNTLYIYVSTNTKLKLKTPRTVLFPQVNILFSVNALKPGLIPN